MAVTANALRELHRIHRQQTDLRERLDRGPKQVRAADAGVRKMEMDLEKTKEMATKIHVKSDDLQLQLKQREDRIEDLQTKLNGCGSNREYQTLQGQIAADKQANGVLSDEILEALERLDELSEKLRAAEDNLARIQNETGKVKQRVASEEQMLSSELARVQGALNEAEAALPFELRREYERIAKVRGEDALAQVEGECCGGCHQMLPPQIMNELYMARPVFCKSCGCLMYLSEGRVPGEL